MFPPGTYHPESQPQPNTYPYDAAVSSTNNTNTAYMPQAHGQDLPYQPGPPYTSSASSYGSSGSAYNTGGGSTYNTGGSAHQQQYVAPSAPSPAAVQYGVCIKHASSIIYNANMHV
jgi:hypothetical protein